jgi:hypothetical protein
MAEDPTSKKMMFYFSGKSRSNIHFFSLTNNSEVSFLFGEVFFEIKIGHCMLVLKAN